MTREKQIRTEALMQLENGMTKEPLFYDTKVVMRSVLGNPPLIEILPHKITVIDHDLTVHRF